MMPMSSRRTLPLLFTGLSLFALLCADVNGYTTNGHTWGTNNLS